MSPEASPGERLSAVLEAASPALAAALSPLGRRVAFPPDIPFQAAEARGKTYNATIGQITDGHASVLRPAALDRALAGLPVDARDRAVRYSPVEGIRELREAWRAWQRRDLRGAEPSTLPLVTVGLTHGLAIAADLFAAPGRAVVVPQPFWGNYRQSFANRTGAELVAAPAWEGGALDCGFVERALAGRPAGEPAVAALNFPSNPGGYSPTADERRRLLEALGRAADRRPLVVVCDDAYAGLVYDAAAPRHSLFWDLAGLHPNLVPVKVDGATKEVSFFGGRVGFLTFAFEPDSEAAAALESKVKCLVRAVVGSPVATSQVMLLDALHDGELESELERIHDTLSLRCHALQRALAGVDRGLLTPLPCNAGCFALLELTAQPPIAAEAVRRRLLDAFDTGVVAVGERYLRIAFCSVDEEALAELVRRIERAVAELAAEAVESA